MKKTIGKKLHYISFEVLSYHLNLPESEPIDKACQKISKKIQRMELSLYALKGVLRELKQEEE